MNTFNRRILQSTVILVFAGLTACESGPQYRTDTSYVAPPTSQGATCVATCQTSEQVCRSRQEDTARAEYPACLQRAKADYKICMSGGSTINCSLYKDLSEQTCARDMEPSYRTCVSSYNSCYQSCGGEVKQKTVCVKNCD